MPGIVSAPAEMAGVRKRRGFSLPELLVCLALVTVVGALTLLGLQGRQSRYPARALADSVVEQLRLARQQAITEQQPVAIGLPSAGGTLPVSQSLFWATGRSMARVTKVIDFSRSYPGQVLFQGVWGSGASIFPPASGGSREGFRVASWLNNPNLGGHALGLDYCLVFTPDGGVTSNGLPLQNGAYHLLVAGGVNYAPTAAPPSLTAETTALNYFQATSADAPRSIAITPTGTVSLAQDLNLTQATQSVGAVAPAPPLTPLPAASPAGASVTILPRPTTVVPGVNVTMVAGQRVTLAVNATDPSGHDLHLEWTAQRDPGNASPSNGTFSRKGFQPMRWNAAAQQWTASWDWICPLDASPNDRFTFHCQFGDGLGVVQAGPVGPTILAIPPSPQIFYACSDQAMGTADCTIVQANGDGSFPRIKVTLPGNDWANELAINPQGTVFYHWNGTIYSLLSGQSVGSYYKLGWNAPSISADGKWAASDAPDPAGHLSAIGVHPTNSTVTDIVVTSRAPLIANSNWSSGWVAATENIGRMPEGYIWSPDRAHLIYSNGDGLHQLDLAESGSSLVATADHLIPGTVGSGAGFFQNMVAWKPDSSGFYFSTDSYAGGNLSLVDSTTQAITPLPQLDPLSLMLVNGLHGVTPQPPASDGSQLWATQAMLSPLGDKFYFIDPGGRLSTAEISSGTIKNWSTVPPGVQALRLANP